MRYVRFPKLHRKVEGWLQHERSAQQTAFFLLLTLMRLFLTAQSQKIQTGIEGPTVMALKKICLAQSWNPCKCLCEKQGWLRVFSIKKSQYALRAVGGAFCEAKQ